MIQELFGGAGLLGGGGGERKFSFNGTGIILEGSPTSSFSPSPSPSPSSTTPTTASASATNSTTNTSTSSDHQQNLRCPRCDSLNTKFCYYNNYNLTQPRHFCKTCRRYWTKGGALRNIPIGGGCRKSKSSSTVFATTTTATVAGGKSNGTAGKVLKTASYNDIVKSNLGSGFDHQSYNNPILWPSAPSAHNSQLFALLRASSQNPNPNPNSCVSMKNEGVVLNNGSSHMDSRSAVVASALNARTLNLDPLMSGAQQVPFGLCNNQQQQQHSFLLQGDHQMHNIGIQELHQRLRSSENYYSTDNNTVQPGGLNHVTSTSSSSSMSILESAPGGEMGFWNPPCSWSDPPTTTTNGAFP